MCQQGIKRCSPSVVAARRKSKRRQKFVRERKDPAKMAHSRMALGKRGLGAKPANSNSIEHQEQGTHSCMRTQADRQGAGMGRCSSPLMTRKPQTIATRKLACTRMGLEPTTHAVGACTPIQSSCSCRGSRCAGTSVGGYCQAIKVCSSCAGHVRSTCTGSGESCHATRGCGRL